MWDNHFAEVYAQGKHYGYGADVRVDSDPVGLMRSLHHSIYKGMESKLLACEKALASRESTRPGLQKMACSRFTKGAELEQKEARYKEVVEAIKEYNEKHVARGEECQLDWETLGGWTAENVAQEVERFVSATSTVIVTGQREESVYTSSQIQDHVKTLYAFELPQKLLESMDKQLCHGKLTSQKAMEIIQGAVQDFDLVGPRWCDGNRDGLAGSYRRNEGRTSAGDVLVRKASETEGQTYKAFLVIKEGLEKYLGCDESAEAVKERARRFYIFNNVATKLTQNADMSNVGIAPMDGQRNHRSLGLEY
jgi:hypothetical protein